MIKTLIAGVAFTLLTLFQAHASDIMCSVAHAGQMCIPDNKTSTMTKRWFYAVDESVGDGSQCKEASEDELVAEFGHFKADPPDGGRRYVIVTEKSAKRVLFTLGETWFADDGNPTHSIRTTIHAGWFKNHDECMDWAPPDLN